MFTDSGIGRGRVVLWHCFCVALVDANIVLDVGAVAIVIGDARGGGDAVKFLLLFLRLLLLCLLALLSFCFVLLWLLALLGGGGFNVRATALSHTELSS